MPHVNNRLFSFWPNSSIPVLFGNLERIVSLSKFMQDLWICSGEAFLSLKLVHSRWAKSSKTPSYDEGLSCLYCRIDFGVTGEIVITIYKYFSLLYLALVLLGFQFKKTEVLKLEKKLDIQKKDAQRSSHYWGIGGILKGQLFLS